MLKIVCLIAASLLSLLPLAADSGAAMNVQIEENDMRVLVGEHVDEIIVSVCQSPVGGFRGSVVLEAPAGCVMKTWGQVREGSLLIASLGVEQTFWENTYANCSFGITNGGGELWSHQNELGFSISGKSVDMVATVKVFHPNRITTEGELQVFLEHGRSPKTLTLTADITLTQMAVVERIFSDEVNDVTIDLNGHTIRRSLSAADADGHVFYVKEGGKLTIVDNNEEGGGLITGGWANNGGGINVASGGTLHFKGGIIQGCKGAQTGGAIRNNGTTYMTGGLITDNQSADCGGIYNAQGATLVLGDPDHISDTGNTISYCTSSAGGGGVVNYGTLRIYGGTIGNNTATTRGGGIWNNNKMEIWGGTIAGNNASNNYGGGIYNGESGILTIYGGSITANTAPDGGGIYNSAGGQLHIADAAINNNVVNRYGGGGVTNYGAMSMIGGEISGNTCTMNGGGIWVGGDAATLQMSDHPVVAGNTSGSTPNNVFLKSGKKIKVSAVFTTGANVHVTTESTQNSTPFTEHYAKLNPTAMGEDYFHYDDTNYGLFVYRRELARLPYATNVAYINEEGATQTKDKCLKVSEVIDVSNVNTGYGGCSLSEGWYVVDSNKKFEGNLLVLGDVHLVLGNGSTLEVCRDIWVLRTASLTIHAQTDKDNSSVGKLRPGQISGYSGSSHIGGGSGSYYYDTEGDEVAAWYSDEDILNSGPIRIYGGNITAQSRCGAGIGGGAGGLFSSIDIRNAKVVATGDLFAAGIGNGSIANKWEYNIHLQRVDIDPFVYNESISIRNSEVTATGSRGGAGIGGGVGGVNNDGVSGGYFLGTITIENSTVTATGGTADNNQSAGAGIGSGAEGSCYLFRFPAAEPMERYATINIQNSTVTAIGGVNAAAIGGGTQGISNPVINPDTYQSSDMPEFQGGGANVSIIGSTVTLSPGTGASAQAIGHGGILGNYANAAPSGTVQIDDGARVRRGYNFSDYTTANDRILILRHNYAARIEPCDHSGQVQGAYSKNLVDGLRHGSCAYCSASSTLEAHAFGDYGLCADCGLISLPYNTNNEDRINYWTRHDAYSHSYVLSGRTFYKNNEWNTICLPFNFDFGEDLTGLEPLSGATVMGFEEAAFDPSNGTLTLNFYYQKKHNDGYSVGNAGEPYLIKWGSGQDIVNPVFRNVELNGVPAATSLTVHEKTSESDLDYSVAFRGTYAPCIWDKETPTVLFLGAGNTLFYPDGSAATTLNAFRAYFELTGIHAGTSEAPEPDFVHSFNLHFGDDESTGIVDVEANAPRSAFRDSRSEWFTLDGQRLSGKPTRRGIYVTNGRKVLVK